MKRKFILTTAIATSIMMGGFFAQTLVANAETINHVQPRTTINKIENNKVITNEVKSGEITNVEQLQKAITPKDAKLVSTKTVYVRIDNSKDSKVSKDSKTKVFTKEQYKELKANEIKNSVGNAYGVSISSGGRYSWIELNLELYNCNGQYTAYGYYQWLTDPSEAFTDSVVMQGSQVSFDVGGSSLQNIVPALGYSNYAPPTVTNENSNSSECFSQIKDGVTSIAYQFSIGGAANVVKPYGVITLPFSPLSYNTPAQLVLEYIHNDTLVPISVKITLGPVGVTESHWGVSSANVSANLTFN